MFKLFKNINSKTNFYKTQENVIEKIFVSNFIFKNFCINNNNKTKFNILFFGNDDISFPTLAKLYEEMHNENSIIKSLGVVTTPLENKKSFQAGFHKFINDKNIFKVELNVKSKDNLKDSWRELTNVIQEKKYDIGIVASFGRMIPGTIIHSLKNGAFVMHPSLLPKYRGAAPIQHALLNNEKKTGVTIVECSMNKFDAGDIVLQKEMSIENFHRFKELSLILSHMGKDATMEFLNTYNSSMKNKKPQEEELVTKAGLITDSNFVYLDFINKTSEEILSLYKSFFGSQLEPFTRANVDGKDRLLFFENLFNVTTSSEFYKLILKKIEKIAKPGDFYWDLKEDRNNIFIKTNNGWVVSNKIKMDGLGYTPCEKIITKVFMNKRFINKENNELAIKALPKKEEIAKIL